MTPEALAALQAAAFSGQPPRPWTSDEFADLLAQPGTRLVCREAGFALLRLAGPEAELLTLAVDPAQRRQGHGAALLEEAERTLRASGVEDWLLEVAETNAPARALYAAAGFEPAGRRKDYYESPRGPKVSAVVMRKRLAVAEAPPLPRTAPPKRD